MSLVRVAKWQQRHGLFAFARLFNDSVVLFCWWTGLGPVLLQVLTWRVEYQLQLGEKVKGS